MFINERITQTGISPSFDEMKEALELRSKSGIHRLITALEERGFIRRLAHRARALEVIRLPDDASLATTPSSLHADAVSPNAAIKNGDLNNNQTMAHDTHPPSSVVQGEFGKPAAQSHQAGDAAKDSFASLPVLGRIAAGTPIEAIQHEVDRFSVPAAMIGQGEHYILEVQGESMINAGIHDGDIAVIKQCNDAPNGDIVVALVEDQEATLKRLRKKGASIALEAENPAFETRIYGSDKVKVQGKLVGLMRVY